MWLRNWLIVCLIPLAMATQAVDNEALRAVSQGTNEFSSSLVQAVTEENQGNLIMSPISAAIVLAMASYGARGETENQFKRVLHLPSPESLGTAGYQALIDSLNNVKENKLSVANKVFATDKFPVKPAYQQLTASFFRSATQSVDFAKSVEAANIVNTWVQQNTNNLIKSIVNPDDLSSDTALVLVNAVYFKGQWKNKFNSNFTKPMPFHINENTVRDVPTMYRQGSYKHGNIESLNAQFIEIPYKGGELSMVIILPNEINGLAECERKMRDMNMNDILNQGYSRDVQLFLPKFKIESKIDLRSVLIKLGLTDMFTTHANFSGMADGPLAVSKVVQKAFIEVNEEGSEAAAVTGLIAVRCSLFQSEVRIDRPFFYGIVKTLRNDESNTSENVLIFTGQVNDPSI
ncbi:antitrypsin-like isoform X2 [Hylaeus anthracinus]|uniref:antitrypsin-like isoform X2 n=1 Tax=Hylaeus anthracinus TaxID=313031 RepID=UPI0023B96611|nr:antitrypsin-like isoform X2 [Hylaeus anthracinus]